MVDAYATSFPTGNDSITVSWVIDYMWLLIAFALFKQRQR